MKSIIYVVFSFLVVFFTSCQKEEVKPVSTPTPATNVNSTYSIEYKVYAVSGNFEVTYKVPQNGTMVEKTETVNRLNHSINFVANSGNKLTIEAKNSIPSTDEVQVAIYVNGTLVKEGVTVSANGTAEAEHLLQ